MDYINFLDNIFLNLKDIGIDVDKYVLDHVAYRATTDQQFKKISDQLKILGKKIHRITIRNRYVDIYRLNDPIKYLQRTIEFIELLAPAEGDNFKEGLEHVEFIIDDLNLHDFVKKYNSLDWNVNSIDRKIGAEVGIKFKNGANIKFKTMSMPEIIRLESER
ncbi:MAG: VOC family protein [Microgenomates group bacterium]